MSILGRLEMHIKTIHHFVKVNVFKDFNEKYERTDFADVFSYKVCTDFQRYKLVQIILTRKFAF